MRYVLWIDKNTDLLDEKRIFQWPLYNDWCTNHLILEKNKYSNGIQQFSMDEIKTEIYWKQFSHNENWIGTLICIDFLHMLRMLIWTPRSACCASEDATEEGWHLGEHEGSTSFRPHLELGWFFMRFMMLLQLQGITCNPQHGSLSLYGTDKCFQCGHTSSYCHYDHWKIEALVYIFYRVHVGHCIAAAGLDCRCIGRVLQASCQATDNFSVTGTNLDIGVALNVSWGL